MSAPSDRSARWVREPRDVTLAVPIIEVLSRRGVRYIVIGGIAGQLHGSATLTWDLDVCYARDEANLGALSAALVELRASLRGAPAGLPFRPDPPTLKAGLNFTFATKFGAFDCLGEAAGRPRALSAAERGPTIASAFGSFTYELLEPNAVRMRLGRQDVRVASLDDLIRMKRAAGRPQDIAEVERLDALRELREDAAPYRTTVRRAARTPSPAKRRPSGRAR